MLDTQMTDAAALHASIVTIDTHIDIPVAGPGRMRSWMRRGGTGRAGSIVPKMAAGRGGGGVFRRLRAAGAAGQAAGLAGGDGSGACRCWMRSMA